MIIIDYSQIAISNILQTINFNKSEVLSEELIRHMILNQIRSIVKPHKEKYGKVVIACDSGKSWRKRDYPFYKANRRGDRDATGFDWKFIFDSLARIRNELDQYSPYKVVCVDMAEADDIIAALALREHVNEPILIVSSDKDFIQLQTHENISQYSPLHKKMLREKDPDNFLVEHILRGDTSDGIPNALSPSDSLIMKTRQKPVTKKALQDFKQGKISQDVKERYEVNRKLIDLTMTPPDIKEKIFAAYEAAPTSRKMEFLDYMVAMKLKNLTSVIGDF